MFLPALNSPWVASTYTSLPRSGPSFTGAHQEPLMPYHPLQYPLTATAVEDQCSCHSCACARAASADDFNVRLQPRSGMQPPAYYPHAHLRYQHNPHWLHHRQAPYGQAHVAARVPVYDHVDDVYAERPQQERRVWHAEPYHPPHSHVSMSSSRPTASHAWPVSFTGVEPEAIATTCYRDASPCTAHGPPVCEVPAASQWQQQEPAPSTHATTSSSSQRQQVKVQQASHRSPTSVPVMVNRIMTQQQQEQQLADRAPPGRQLSRTKAATIIQSWWRMVRLVRQQATLKSLAATAAQLHSTTAMFEQYTANSTAGSSSITCSRPAAHLDNKQYLELNELAMRVLLQLDATQCSIPELRAVHKRLTAAAIKLLDDVQGAYSAAVHCSMELAEEVVMAAVHDLDKAADMPTAADPATSKASSVVSGDQMQQHVTREPADQHQSQQQPQMQFIEGTAPSKAAASVAGCTPAAAPTAFEAAVGKDYGYFLQLPLADGERGIIPVSPTVGQEQQQQQATEASESAFQGGNCALSNNSVLHGLSAGVRVVLVYPGSMVDVATQTD